MLFKCCYGKELGYRESSAERDSADSHERFSVTDEDQRDWG